MCNLCEKLVKSDKNHEASSVIIPETEFTDSYNEEWVGEEIRMVLNHNKETLEPEAYIIGGAVHRSGDSEYYGNNVFTIRFCPFCGEKLY